MRRSGLTLAALAGLIATFGNVPGVAAVAPPAVPSAAALTPAAVPVEATGPAAPTDRTSYRMTATYDVTASIGWAKRVVAVDTTIHITNTSGGPVGRLALNTTAAAIGSMHLRRVVVAGRRVSRG